MAVTVQDIITAQQSNAAEVIGTALGYLAAVRNLGGVQFNIGTLPQFGFTWFDRVGEAEDKFDALKPARPSLTGVVPGTIPDAPLLSFDAAVPISVPDFLKVAPTLNIPPTPSNVLPSVPTAPSLDDVPIPSAPTVTLPPEPVITAITFPTPPSIEIPEFSSTLPIADIVAPTATFQFYEEAYVSALLDALKAKLFKDLTEGGYGIEPQDESALWERARARELATGEAEIDEIYRVGSARAFPLPPGDLTAAVQRVRQKAADNLSGLNREIALKRSDLFVDNRKFTIKETKELENILINYHNAVMERSLNAAKALVEMQIAIFNALVSRYNAYLTAYRTEADVFEAKIRASLAKVEIFKAQMEGSRLQLEVQKVGVDIYRAQLDGIQTIVGIYRTRMEAAAIQAGIQRTKLEAFRALIDAFGAQVQAKVAEFNMYDSQIKGETAKINAFEAEVRAYVAIVSASKAKADIQVANLQAQVEQARAQVSVFEAQITKFKADLEAQVQVLKSGVDVYQGDLTAYSTSVTALKDSYLVDIAFLDNVTKWNSVAAEVNIKAAVSRLEAAIQSSKYNAGIAEYVATQYTNQATAAIASVGTLAAQTATG